MEWTQIPIYENNRATNTNTKKGTLRWPNGVNYAILKSLSFFFIKSDICDHITE